MYDPVPAEDSLSPEVESSDQPGPRFSITDFLVQCVIPPLLGLSFVAFGLYIHYNPNPIVISFSTQNAAVISQGFTALFAVWHFFALIPALSVVSSVRSEEWWRRLLHSTTFNRANSVSSNVSGNVAHLVEMFISWSSPYHKIALFVAIFAAILTDIAPGAIHVEVGLNAIDDSFTVPALPPNSIYSDYSKPFFTTNDTLYDPVDIAPMYFNALMMTASYVTAKPLTLNASVVPGQGYRYLTDVAIMEYECDWHAPEVAEPDTMADLDTQNLSITVGDFRGLDSSPFFANAVHYLGGYTNASTGAPSFAGYIAFTVSSGTPTPGYGYLNLTTLPTYTLSAAWKAAAAAYRANNTGVFEPPDSLSAVLCSPGYTLEPWIVELVNGTVSLVEKQLQAVGNLDPTQLQIAIQDCFNMLFTAPPNIISFGFSDTLLGWLFNLNPQIPTIGTPKSSANITFMTNYLALPTLVQAYLDNSPFGNFTPPNSKLLTPAVIFSAQLEFIYVTSVLYVLLTVMLLYLFMRSSAQPLTIRSVLKTTVEVPVIPEVVRGREAAAFVEQIAFTGCDKKENEAKMEARVNHTIGDCTAVIQDSFPTHDPFLEINSNYHSIQGKQVLEHYGGMNTGFAWMLTPGLGAALVGFAIASYMHPRIVGPPQGMKDILFSTLFTWGIGLWRSMSLTGINALILWANSDEWSRLLRSQQASGLTSNLRATLNEISTNKLSALGAFRAAWMAKTSIFFKIGYIAAMFASLCAVIAHGAVTLLILPASVNEQLVMSPISIPTPVEVPWSADQELAPLNAGKIAVGRLATNWVYLEQVVGATVLDTLPPGYLVPTRGASNNTDGSRYPTDVVHIECNCTWVAPTLPAAANVSYINVTLKEFDISALQTVPNGVAIFAPLSNMTFSSNMAPVTSGLFAWTLWGGGPGDAINLDSVPHTVLSVAWQSLIIEEFAPAYANAYPGRAAYITNVTRASTLVCDPNIKITTRSAYAFGGFIGLEAAPSKYDKGVGNLDKEYVSFTIYNYAVQQAWDIIGEFRPYLLFGVVTGNATLDADPLNPVGGTVPKPPTEIAAKMDAYISSGSKT